VFRNVVCVLVLNARSSGSPAVVQYCHQLKFHWNRWYSLRVWRSKYPAHVLHAT